MITDMSELLQRDLTEDTVVTLYLMFGIQRLELFKNNWIKTVG